VLHDPARLRDGGFRGNVPREFVQCEIAFESYDPAICPPDSAERAWLEEQARMSDRMSASDERPRGLSDLVRGARYAGIWTWSRGGGWIGPYLPDEFWCHGGSRRRH
jgi:hypothetical protein